jgi:hypothetical protein
MALLYWYQSTYYAVQRRDDLKRLIVPPAVHTGAMTELFTGCMTVIAGKVARLRSPYCVRNAVPTDTSARITDLSDVIMSGSDRFLAEYVPMRKALVARLAETTGAQRDWATLVDVAFASHIRKNWPEGTVWSKLAEKGDIPREDLAVLGAPGIESEVIPIPGEYLVGLIQPLASRGWPSFG